MKVWALTDGPVKEGKYLVVRRDGTVPKWDHFVMASTDICAADAIRAYEAAAAKYGYEQDFVDSVYELANRFEDAAAKALNESKTKGVKGSNPDAGPHRQDNATVIAMMRGEFDVADLCLRLAAAEAERDAALARVGEMETALIALNKAIDDMWNDSDRGEIGPRHMVRITAAQGSSQAALAQPEKGEP